MALAQLEQIGLLAPTRVGVSPLALAALMPFISACVPLEPLAATSPGRRAARVAPLRLPSLDEIIRAPSLVSVTAIVTDLCVLAVNVPASSVARVATLLATASCGPDRTV